LEQVELDQQMEILLFFLQQMFLPLVAVLVAQFLKLLALMVILVVQVVVVATVKQPKLDLEVQELQDKVITVVFLLAMVALDSGLVEAVVAQDRLVKMLLQIQVEAEEMA
jgi:hypothetical protein